eukprot:5462395-Amphidinium_carterae.1
MPNTGYHVTHSYLGRLQPLQLFLGLLLTCPPLQCSSKRNEKCRKMDVLHLEGLPLHSNAPKELARRLMEMKTITGTGAAEAQLFWPLVCTESET